MKPCQRGDKQLGPVCEVREHRGLDAEAKLLDPVGRGDSCSFYDTAWLSAWDRAFLPGQGWNRPIIVYSVASDGSPIGFLAVADQKVFGFRIKSLAGYYWPFRTLAVRNDAEARRAFAHAIAAHFDGRSPGFVLRFGPVSGNDKALSELLDALATQGWHMLRRKTGDVFELDLPGDPRDLEAGISASLIKNINYQRRRLYKLVGTVSCERYVLGDDAGELLDVLARVEAASWVAKGGGDVKFLGQANRNFWVALGRANERISDAVIWIMRCGQTAIAFSAHIETADTIYIIANSYDEEWKAFSPGSILSLDILTDGCRRGKTHIDWGQGDSGYKSRWGAKCGTKSLQEVMLFRPGLFGKFLARVASYRFFVNKEG